MKTGEPYHSPEFAERRRDIRVEEIYEWQIQRITMPTGELGVVCFFNNITERKRAEWELLREKKTTEGILEDRKSTRLNSSH